jgi:cytochrome c-type biogenesis protein CcmF
MESIQYVGETLWIRNLGNFLVMLSFVSAIVSAIAYAYAAQKRNTNEFVGWKNIARWGFYTHGVSILMVIALLLFAMMNYYYEYVYVFEHVSDDLPMRYVLSAFWEGQEGSFMVWMFWHVILGFILIRYSGKWEFPVLFVIAALEIILASMLLGVYFNLGDISWKIGSNPTLLLRETTDAPIFNNAEYLSLIKGRGLNPLLQNYWMTIHPPTLFLGFAATVVPFAYAIAGMWYKNHTEWLKPALKWALFAAGILGVGIFMGSIWAYVNLSFGGYWAWDPVENTSLVPWIMLVAGIHTNLIAKKTGHSIKSTYIFYIFAFVLILYSTTLTRSGILGDTSVHSFTEMGLEWQLFFLVAFFLVLGLSFFFVNKRSIPVIEKEESIYSREFWMFIGSLILLFSSVLITASSSLPVFNTIAKIFNPDYVGRVIKDPISHYNQHQHWIGVFVALIAGFTIFLRYKEFSDGEKIWKKFRIQIAAHFVLAALLTFLLSRGIELYSWQYTILAFTSFYVVVANFHYLTSVLGKDVKLGASAISHAGFGLMIIGVLGSGLNMSFLSNPFVFKGLFQDGDEDQYVQLIKNKPILLKDHIVTYESDTLIGNLRFYTIDFQKVDSEFNVISRFKTKPDAIYSNDFSKIEAFNPDAKQYLWKDVWTCLAALPPPIMNAENARQMEDTIRYQVFDTGIGDSIKLEKSIIIVHGLNFNPTHPEFKSHHHDFGIELKVSVLDLVTEEVHEGVVAIGLEGPLVYKYPFIVESLGMRIRPADDILDNYFSFEDQLSYKKKEVLQGERFQFSGCNFVLKGFDNKDLSHPEIKDEDLAVAAILGVNCEGKSYEARPIYLIRDSYPMTIKDYIPEEGIHIRLSQIDPVNELFTLHMAKDQRSELKAPIEIADNVPRTDYIVAEIRIFPAINLYWLGCLMMMFGLLFAATVKLRNKNN